MIEETKYKQSKSETEEYYEDLFACDKCGSSRFKVFCTIIIDDARLYCADCGEEKI